MNEDRNTVHVVMRYDRDGYGTLLGVCSTGAGADRVMRDPDNGEQRKGCDIISHEVPVDGPLYARLVTPRV